MTMTMIITTISISIESPSPPRTVHSFDMCDYVLCVEVEIDGNIPAEDGHPFEASSFPSGTHAHAPRHIIQPKRFSFRWEPRSFAACYIYGGWTGSQPCRAYSAM